MKKVSSESVVAVVVTYNRVKLLQECLEALKKCDCDILIVDNASTDGTKSVIDKKYRNDVIYRNTGKNLGGAGGFSYGLEEAYKLGYGYFWVMDDDCVVNADALKRLQEAGKKMGGRYGFLASRVLWTDGSLCRMNVPKVSLLEHVDARQGSMRPIIMATFVSVLFKATTVEKYGLPMAEFFIWGDDLEYTRRISRYEKSYYVPDSIVIHKTRCNNGSNLAVDDIDRIERYRYAYRNESVIFRMEGVGGRILFLLKKMYHFWRIVFTSKDHRCLRIETMRRGVSEGKNFYPEVKYV